MILEKFKANVEIERKFLVIPPFPQLINGQKITQAYIFVSDNKELRIRIVDNKCKMSIKINLDKMLREEYQYDISLEEGYRIIELGTERVPIVKIRYTINYKNMDWEIDFFEGENEGLVVAEIELNHLEQKFEKPSWAGEEVTCDQRYYNKNLYQNPYKYWNI